MQMLAKVSLILNDVISDELFYFCVLNMYWLVYAHVTSFKKFED